MISPHPNHGTRVWSQLSRWCDLFLVLLCCNKNFILCPKTYFPAAGAAWASFASDGSAVTGSTAHKTYLYGGVLKMAFQRFLSWCHARARLRLHRCHASELSESSGGDWLRRSKPSSSFSHAWRSAFMPSTDIWFHLRFKDVRCGD